MTSPSALSTKNTAVAMNRLLLLLPLALLVLQGCSRELDAGTTPVTPAVPVTLADVSEEVRAMPIRTSGRLSAKKEQKLSFKIGGLIAFMTAEEGVNVRQGALLAQLNTAEIDAQVLQAESAVAKAQRDLARAEGLLADSVATLEQVQDAGTALEVAEANLRIARFNRQYAVIRAPSSGKVLRRMAEDNELVAPGAPVYLFGADREGWVVRVGLADRDVVNVALGDEATMHFDAFPDSLLTGRVTEIASAADPFSGTFEVEVALENPSVPLRSGWNSMSSRMMRRICERPFLGGMNFSIWSVKKMTPILSLF